MTEELNASIRATELMNKARDAGFRGDLQKALELAGEAISIAERAGIDVFPLEALRELLLFDAQDSQNKDFSGLIAVMQRAIAFYAHQHNVPKRIDMLISLISALVHAGDKHQALHYSSEVENLLSSTTPADISKHLPEGIILTGETFLQLRRSQLERIKNHLETL